FRRGIAKSLMAVSWVKADYCCSASFIVLRVTDDGADYTPNGQEAKPLWRLPASAILLKLHVQRLSIAGDLYLGDTGQPKQPERVGKPHHFAFGVRPVHLAADRAANVGRRSLADADVDRIAVVSDGGRIVDTIGCSFGLMYSQAA